MAALHGVQLLQRTDLLAQDVGGDLRVQGGRFQLLVPEQHLNQADVDLLFQQVGGKPILVWLPFGGSQPVVA